MVYSLASADSGCPAWWKIYVAGYLIPHSLYPPAFSNNGESLSAYVLRKSPFALLDCRIRHYWEFKCHYKKAICFLFTFSLRQCDCVRVPMPTHQVLPLTGYLFKAIYSICQPSRLTKFRAWTNQNS